MLTEKVEKLLKEIEFHFEGKNFVVVGASSGIGRQIALELAEAGAHVLAVARNKERLEKLKQCNPDFITVQTLDILRESKLWSEIFQDHVCLNGKFHGGVYTAGISMPTPLRAYNEELARTIIDTSFFGWVKFVQCLTKKKFSEQGASHVVFSSVAANEGPKGLLFYTAAKSAVQATIKTMAKEIANRNHRINCISPAWVDTEMTRHYLDDIGIGESHFIQGPLGMGHPYDVSGAALFLLSDRARWITGTNLVVDGGYLCGTWK